jgi:hypothetical protein
VCGGRRDVSKGRERERERERERDDIKRITQNFHIHKLRIQIANANRAKRLHTAVRTVNKVKRSEDMWTFRASFLLLNPSYKHNIR